MLKNKKTPFVAYVPSFNLGDDALLLLVDSETIEWLMAQFGRLSNTPVGSGCPSSFIGDGNPVESDGCCLLVIELEDQTESSRLIRKSENTFNWSVSRSSANHYRDLLSGLLVPLPGHQYLDPDNSPLAPVVIVSRDEYEPDTFRGAKG
jgi:hypothetical protein